jgi:hypothetical protein
VGQRPAGRDRIYRRGRNDGGPGDAPQRIDLNLIRASTADDEQYGWSGKLLPI